MTKRIFALLMALLLALSVFAACSKKSGKEKSEKDSDEKVYVNPLVGTWNSEENGNFITFKEDNKGEIFYNSSLSMLFDYELEDGNHLKMVNSAGSVIEYDFEADGEYIILTDDGYSEKYTKVEEGSVKPSGKPVSPDSIIGSWQTEKDGVVVTMIFEEAGEGSWKLDRDGLILYVDMEWEASNDELVMHITQDGVTQTSEGTYEIKGDSLTLSLGGETQTLKRVTE